VRLYEGNRDRLAELELDARVPRRLTDALGSETGPVPGRFDRGGGKDDSPTDTVRWFRAVDRAIGEHHPQPPGVPLLLAALPEHRVSRRRHRGEPARPVAGRTARARVADRRAAVPAPPCGLGRRVRLRTLDRPRDR